MDPISNNSYMSPPATKKRRLSFNEAEYQSHGLPGTILYYLKKNSSPQLLLKLMQICRYFLHKEFPFLVVKDLKYDKGKWQYRKGKYLLFNYEELDLENLSKPLWIIKAINNYTDEHSLVSRLLSNVVVCDIRSLRFEDQIISMKEFKLLITGENVETFNFCYSHVVDDDGGRIVEIDEIIRMLPNVTSFKWILDPEMASTFIKETTKKIIAALNPSILSSFTLMNIPASFDIHLFAKFMSANPTIDYELDFDVLIPIQCSKILQAHVDKFVKHSSIKYIPFRICFPRQTEASINAIEELYERYNQRKSKTTL